MTLPNDHHDELGPKSFARVICSMICLDAFLLIPGLGLAMLISKYVG